MLFQVLTKPQQNNNNAPLFASKDHLQNMFSSFLLFVLQTKKENDDYILCVLGKFNINSSLTQLLFIRY